jgi:hypothetical protein
VSGIWPSTFAWVGQAWKRRGRFALSSTAYAVNDQNHVKSTATTQCHQCDGQCCYYTRILNNKKELVVISYLAFVLF